nr:chlorite dismutase family protein [Chenggangzhangella methanolivorans]
MSFIGGASGPWRVERIEAIAGAALPPVRFVDVVTVEPGAPKPPGEWVLTGATSNTRYTTRIETSALTAKQEPLGRSDATLAALIPIRKSPSWWSLAQDERRSIFEAQSRHIAIGLDYLPAIARRLHHARDLGEPFDFLTWFEFRPEDEADFDALVARLRDIPEWSFVEREVDIRLRRPD